MIIVLEMCSTVEYCLYRTQMRRIFPVLYHLNMIFILTLLLTAAFATVEQPKLIFVQQVFRHGARYPIYPNAKDGSNFAVDQKSVGELTSQGKAMHYMLGQLLYEAYWDKLFGANRRYNQSKFYFKSTDVNRTIESIQSQLLGIFQKIEPIGISNRDLDLSLPAWNHTIDRGSGLVFTTSQTFHPLPVHVEKGEMSPWYKADFLRTYSADYCYKQNDWMKENMNEAYIRKIVSNENFVKAIAEVSKAVGTNLTFYDIYKYYDNAECMTHLDMSDKVLEVFKRNTQTLKALNTIYVLDGYIKFFHNEQQKRAITTGYFNATVNNFKTVTKDQSGVQWAFYSAHDTTVMAFLSRLGLTSVKCIYQNYLNGTVENSKTEYCIPEYPTYTSNLIFEVYQYSNGLNTFKIRYNGYHRRIPFCDWSYECAVQKMYEWYESWKDEDYVKNCGIVDRQGQTYFSIMMVELFLIIIFAVAFLLQYLNKKQPEVGSKPNSKEAAHQEQVRGDKMLKESLISEEETN